MIKKLKKELEDLANAEQAEILQKFFKTNLGEYGEGDIFLGIKVPILRKTCNKYNLKVREIQLLLNSKIHEHRLCAIFILIEKYKKADTNEKEKFFKFYLKNTEKINNWDLVDLSAPNIIGDFLFNEDKDILYKLAESENLWEKRISIISTLYFIKKGNFKDALKISELLLKDNHDLIHKAVGWMLREVGKRNIKALEKFLQKHYKKIPRITLRYAIEKFPEEKRKKYLTGEAI